MIFCVVLQKLQSTLTATYATSPKAVGDDRTYLYLSGVECSDAYVLYIFVHLCTVACICVCDFQSQVAKLLLQAVLAIEGTSLKTESGFQREEVQIEIA